MRKMEKRCLALGTLWIVLLLLPACMQAAEPVLSTPQTENDLASEQSLGLPFTLISSPDYRSYGSGNQMGYYGIFDNEDGSRNILYTDYETATQVYLCEQPNCEHNTAACASWIAPGPESVIIAANDQNVFLIASNRNGESYIERCELDGTNREKIFQSPSGTTIENTIAANDKFLIVSAKQYQTDMNLVGHDAKLMLIEIDDGRQETLFTLSERFGENALTNASMHFMGVCDAGCIVEIWIQGEFEFDPNDIEKSFQNQDDAMICTIYCVPWDNSSPKELVSYQNGKGNAAYLEQWLFLLTYSSENRISLSKIDPITGEEELLIKDFQDTFLQEQASGLDVYDFVLRRLLDNTLLMNVMTNGFIDEQGSIQAIYTGVCIDIETGENYERSLVNQYHATTVPVEILARRGDELLVLAEITETSNSYGMAFLERKSGLISIEDFLASKADYRMIQSVRYYQ